MPYRTLADFTVLTHFFWILFLILGALWGRKNKIVRILHISGLLFAVIMQIFGWYCPLTHIESWLRTKYSPGIYFTDSFIIYYLEKIIYLEVSPSAIFAATLFICGFNAYLYLKKGA